MLCTVMVPTRGRVKYLSKMLETVFTSVFDPSCIEIIFRCDEDDVDTQNFLKDKLTDNVRMIVGPRYGGYGELHRFYNEIAEEATGTWLLLANDDMVFNKTDWDIELKKIDEVCFLAPKVILGGNVLPAETGNTFPMMHKKIQETLGHFSKCFLNDCYVCHLGKAVNGERYAPFIEIDHFRYELEDQITAEAAISSPASYDVCEQEYIHKDVETLLNNLPEIFPIKYTEEDGYWISEKGDKFKRLVDPSGDFIYVPEN